MIRGEAYTKMRIVCRAVSGLMITGADDEEGVAELERRVCSETQAARSVSSGSRWPNRRSWCFPLYTSSAVDDVLLVGVASLLGEALSGQTREDRF